MNRKKTKYLKCDSLIFIFNCLINNDYIEINYLLNFLEISRLTLYKYLNSLRDALVDYFIYDYDFYIKDGYIIKIK